MKRHAIVLLAMFAVVAFSAAEMHARGGRGGGGGRGGFSGGGHGGFSGRTPSMSSRPSVSRPSVSRPSVQPSRPSYGGGNFGSSRPSTLPATRPSIGGGNFGSGNRPNIGGGNIGTNRPTTRPVSPPKVGGGNLAGGNRPTTLPSNRPSRNDLQDFLKLPDQPSQLPARTDIGNRPGSGDRPNIGDRPNVGDRPNIGDRPNVGDRPSQLPANVRNHWQNRPDRPFDKDWWNRHPGYNGGRWHWHAHWNNYPTYWCWRPCTWASVGTWLPYAWSDPYYYDYGTTIVYQDNAVYYGDKKVATEAQYAEQATKIADAVPADIDEDKVEWMPLGVFAIAQEGVADSGMLMQLAVSKEGIIAGTYYNETTDASRPLQGTVDEKTQRAAWKFDDDSPNQVTFETGIFNLTKDETNCLVHFSPEKTQTWSMIRIPPPGEENDAAETLSP